MCCCSRNILQGVTLNCLSLSLQLGTWLLRCTALPAAAADALLHDEEIGRAAVPLNSLDASPGAASDLWLPLMRPYSSRRSSRKQQPSVRSGRSSLAQPAGGSPAAGSSPAAASCEDTARHWGALFRRKGSDTQQRQQRQGPDLHRAAGFDRLAQLVPGVPVPVQECALHVRVSYVPFTREEIDVAMQMGRPGIVSILRRLSRVSRVPELLRRWAWVGAWLGCKQGVHGWGTRAGDGCWVEGCFRVASW